MLLGITQSATSSPLISIVLIAFLLREALLYNNLLTCPWQYASMDGAFCVTEVRALRLEKAELPIVVRLFPKVSEVTEEQP
jgi:hypothetical protein